MTLGSGSPMWEAGDTFMGRKGAPPAQNRPYGAAGRRVAALAARWEREGRITEAAEIRDALEGPEDL